jgi:hypothetical protein
MRWEVVVRGSSWRVGKLERIEIRICQLARGQQFTICDL